jgi:hypothetical protein
LGLCAGAKTFSFANGEGRLYASFGLGMHVRPSNHDSYVAFISSSIHGDGIQAIYSGMG